MSSIINWMGGWPKDGLVSATDWEERVEAAAALTATERLGAIERKAEPHGEEKLKTQLAQGFLKERTGGNGSLLTMTNGADGSIAWIVGHLLVAGDTVLTERLTSRTALQIFRKAGMNVVAVAGDRRGLDPEALTTALYRHRPKLVYVAPSCTDPEGANWSPENKLACQERCQEAGVWLVTDDRQESLLYEPEGKRRPKRTEAGVLSIGQLPPGLIAGLRIGWIIGAPERRNTQSRQGQKGYTDKETAISELEQRALSRLIEELPLEPLHEMLRVQCRERMRRLTELLGQRGIPDMTWVEPRGGLHLWMNLPAGVDGEALLRGAWLKGLIFQPGAPYYAKDPRMNTIRITHAYADERQMKLGIERLAESVGEFTGRWSRS
ncbi:PLP-dependent aminotransferase family protein [Cohnella endophytica]|uniref:PLP-dependent aminotransferase family protein n=1 Tax=Cohnella endophytica TaxID=2419778 RepID=A0A494XTU8_9BACL|nr:PLP-dependent aminotransferase family protein [Cohnella endophytica]RKP54010.1 PLP-dependent aminotransferase family protein [Cohnella endophytica]